MTAIATGGALLIQQRMSREHQSDLASGEHVNRLALEQQRQKHEREMVADERSDALAERWRTDRLQAHAELMATMDELYNDNLVHHVVELRGTKKLHARFDGRPEAPGPERLAHALDTNGARVELLATKKARDAAVAAKSALEKLIYMLVLGDGTVAEVERAAEEYRRRRNGYTSCARGDLGTE